MVASDLIYSTPSSQRNPISILYIVGTSSLKGSTYLMRIFKHAPWFFCWVEREGGQLIRIYEAAFTKAQH